VRICSLLPSATEIIVELGLIDSLVGVSEECRWPPAVVGKPVVTAARIDPSTLSSSDIDEAVRRSLRDGESLYVVEADLIADLDPDVIVTQDLCSVCAVSSTELADACPVGAEVISLDPRTLGRWPRPWRRSQPGWAQSKRAGGSWLRCGSRSTQPQHRCATFLGGASSSPSGSIRRSAPVTGSRR
jgi:ABC-type Fe3+-hydroxamate transport system substrate-binding protein